MSSQKNKKSTSTSLNSNYVPNKYNLAIKIENNGIANDGSKYMILSITKDTTLREIHNNIRDKWNLKHYRMNCINNTTIPQTDPYLDDPIMSYNLYKEKNYNRRKYVDWYVYIEILIRN